MELSKHLSNIDKLPLKRLIDAGLHQPPVNPARPKLPLRQLSTAEVDEVCRLYQSGSTIAQLAEQFRVARKTISAHLRKQGVKTRRPSPMSEEDVRAAIQLYQAGHSLDAVAAELGVNRVTIRKRLVEAGVVIRSSADWMGL